MPGTSKKKKHQSPLSITSCSRNVRKTQLQQNEKCVAGEEKDLKNKDFKLNNLT